MRASRWHTQTAQLERRDSSTPERYAGGGYKAAVAIPCRLEHDRKLVRTDSGEEVVSEAVLLTGAELGPGDRVTDPDGVVRTVMSSSKARDTRGRFVQWEARL